MARTEVDHHGRDRRWSRNALPVLLFILIALLVIGDDLRQRRALRETCFDVNSGRALQNISNDNTRTFLLIAVNARRRAAQNEEGAKRRVDLATARLYKALADSYPHVKLHTCPALLPWESETIPPEPHRRPLPTLPQ